MEKLIGRTRPNGDKEVKKIVELSEEEAARSVLLGNAVSADILNCFCVVANHVERLWERVYGYRIIQNEFSEKVSEAFKQAGITEEQISVCFYEMPQEDPQSEHPDFTKMTSEELAKHFGGHIMFKPGDPMIARETARDAAHHAKKKSK